ncbi:hypothetical protein ACO1O0_001755 [Amphichorda felina]
MIPPHILQLCQAQETVTSVLEKDPTEPAGRIFHRLYGHPPRHHAPSSSSSSSSLPTSTQAQALECGRWGPTVPSPLFLDAFADALSCLAPDPTLGMVSPPLMGSHGTVPLAVVAPLLDVARHCSNLLVRAQADVFFSTSVWQPSAAQRLIRNALVELSRRAGGEGRRVAVRIMFDKAAVCNVVDPYRPVKPAEWTGPGIGLPAPEDVPHLDLEVLSFHRLPLGTLHTKFCVVDRKVAVVMSNNVEDNDNLEMMIHVEGPVVEGIYDTALVTWNKHARLPACQVPSTDEGDPSTPFGNERPSSLEEGHSGKRSAEAAVVDQTPLKLPEHTPDDPHYDTDLAAEAARIQSCYLPRDQETLLQAANRQLNATAKNPVAPTGPGILPGEEMTPFIYDPSPPTVPMALVSRPAYGLPDKSSLHVPQNEAFLSLIRHARRSIFIQTPDLNAAPLLPALADALERGVDVTYYVCFGYNDAGESIPGQGGTNEQAARALMALLGRKRRPRRPEEEEEEQRGRLRIYQYVAKDQDRPIHQLFKSRSCHIKLLIADDDVAVQGSGNQDTQSWFHSQEINVMVDSRAVCAQWREAVERNQNTRLFGEVGEDGVWRDKEGNPGEGYSGDPGVVDGLLWGVGGMLKKIRAAGGF